MESNILAQLGVSIVETHALERDWLFRAQPVLDFGIDGHLELQRDGQATARLIAVQVKTGASYFATPTSLGWRHTVSARHAKYWSDGSLPAVVVLVDHERRSAYWQEVTASTLRRTGAAFALEIPRDQRLDADGSWEQLSSIARFRSSDSGFEANLSVMPPDAARRLRKLRLTDSRGAERLAEILATGRASAGDTIAQLRTDPPHWLTPAGFALWRTICAYADDHGQTEHARELLEWIGSSGRRKEHQEARLRAAALWMLEDPSRTIALLDALPRPTRGDLWVRVLRRRAELGPVQAPRLEDEFDFEAEETKFPLPLHVLRAHNALRKKRPADAVRHLDIALSGSGDSSSLMQLASHAIRLRSTTRDAESDDLQRAHDLCWRALMQRRSWGGDTVGYLEDLGQILGQLGRDADVLQLCAPPPVGDASPGEAGRREVAKLALAAAIPLRREDAITAVLDAAPSAEDRAWLVHAFRLGEEPAPASFWESQLAAAVESDDVAGAVDAAHELAWLGADHTAALQTMVDTGALDPGYVETLSAQAEAIAGAPGGQARLRTLASRRLDAANMLAVLLRRAGRFGDAADLAAQTRDRFASFALIELEVDALERAGRTDEADQVAAVGLSSSTTSPEQRAVLFRARAGAAAVADRWSDVVDQLEASRRLPSSFGELDAWNLVIALLRISRIDRAASLIRQLRLRPTNADLVRIWLYARSGSDWDDEEVRLAIDLADRFDGEEVAVALTLHLLMRDHPDDEAWMEEHAAGSERSWSERLQDLFARHSSDEAGAPLQRIRGDIDALIEIIRQKAEQGAEFNRQLQRLLRQGMPTGVISTFLHRPYAYTYDQRPLGMFPAVAVDDDEHEQERDAASAALDQTVVLDGSALVLVGRLKIAEKYLSRFVRTLSAGSTAEDLIESAREARRTAKSAGITSWNRVLNAPTFTDVSDEAQSRLLADASFYEGLTADLDIVAAPQLEVLAELDRSGPWTDPIALAQERGIALWSDDEGQRKLARQLGVRTFSTASLIEAVAVQAMLSDPEVADDTARTLRHTQLQLVRAGVAGLPQTVEEIEHLADTDGWGSGIASLAVTNESWWLSMHEPFRVLLGWFRHAAAAGSNAMTVWEWHAFEGAARVRLNGSTTPSDSIAAVALLAWSIDPDSERAPWTALRMRSVADIWDLPDPVQSLTFAADLLQHLLPASDWSAAGESLTRAIKQGTLGAASEFSRQS
ncbi:MULTISPECIES: DUF4365 domain-containing protein [unclassified Curtobacterium]|uniref:DUF4365 domain-containing protein n=1 Tax=unclassified Curtobacterium TaxID=257496 RepID=UPI000F47687F|nr:MULTISPECIES: DUF4365 domain-containing protein [unclassified Curtobacterium]ROQ04781.1 uncharacterized protein DUF4365 [Curtobacterium sp. PhB171]ROQ28269.1 uncharacterized protein DUF4365 [Curtobacterium sp. PhB170]ROS33199.1 uncharacterized protein DUF4365 [Curtobacterium sp. PhB131]ROS72434.1 uncharacterized protein DUF4365 [Curtobacterium sp. PhB141]